MIAARGEHQQRAPGLEEEPTGERTEDCDGVQPGTGEKPDQTQALDSQAELPRLGDRRY